MRSRATRPGVSSLRSCFRGCFQKQADRAADPDAPGSTLPSLPWQGIDIYTLYFSLAYLSVVYGKQEERRFQLAKPLAFPRPAGEGTPAGAGEGVVSTGVAAEITQRCKVMAR
jgi:hypothetical protein